MEKVLVTGAFGNVGMSTVTSLLDQGFPITILDCPTRANYRAARKLENTIKQKSYSGFTLLWSDIRDYDAVSRAVSGCTSVIHLAAIIPPLADRFPELAYAVNVDGTRNVIRACEQAGITLIYASSIALYGDRLANPSIHVDDPVQPAPGDTYGFQKAEAEYLVRQSSCPWTILRLSYVVSRKKLALDPIMFRMPLTTCIEIVHTEDAGRAFAHAVTAGDSRRRTYNIGGGDRCRTTYRDYLTSMLTLFGLGKKLRLPERAFARQGYHCGWLDSEQAEQVLHFQKKTLADYYVEVAEEARRASVFAAMVPRIILRMIMSRSPYVRSY